MSLGNVDPIWLVAGVVLHLCSQLARGRGWYSVICAAHPDEVRPRRRDVMATWIAGAGASGVLSARGGDALRILLMRRHMVTTCPKLIGTLAAETIAETVLGALLTVWALSAGLVPGLHRPGLATAALIGAGLIALVLVVRRAARRFPAVGRACSDAKRAWPCSAARPTTRAASPRGTCSAARSASPRSPASSPPSGCRLDHRRARRDGRPQLRPAPALQPRERGHQPRPARRRVPGRHAHDRRARAS